MFWGRPDTADRETTHYKHALGMIYYYFTYRAFSLAVSGRGFIHKPWYGLGMCVPQLRGGGCWLPAHFEVAKGQELTADQVSSNQARPGRPGQGLVRFLVPGFACPIWENSIRTGTRAPERASAYSREDRKWVFFTT
jgi:hypothetical protein